MFPIVLCSVRSAQCVTLWQGWMRVTHTSPWLTADRPVCSWAPPHLFMNTGSQLNSEPSSECHITWADCWYFFNIQVLVLFTESFWWRTCRSPRGCTRTTQHAWVNWRSLHDSLWHQTSLTASLMPFCVCGRWAITELHRSDPLTAAPLQHSSNSHEALEKSTDLSSEIFLCFNF